MIRKPKKQFLAALAVAAVFGACSSDDLVMSPDILNEMFIAMLSGANEVPAVTTTAAGESRVTVLDTNTLRVETVITTAIDSVTQAHIHAGPAGANAGIMVWLLGPFSAATLVARDTALNAIGIKGALNNVFVSRSTPTCGTPATAVCIVKPFTFDSVLFRVRNDLAYVNVHTRRNPGGEIRGQIDEKP